MDKALLKKKWENIWYHYKWYIIAGIFLLFCLFYTIIDVSRNKEADVSVTYLGCNVDEDKLSCNLYDKYKDDIKDINNDGKKVFEITPILSSSEAIQGDMFFWQKVDMNIVDGKSYIYLVDEDIFLLLKERGSIVPFNISKDERTYYIDITDFDEAKDVFLSGKKVYLCVRKDVTEYTKKEDKKAIDNGKLLLEKIIEKNQTK